MQQSRTEWEAQSAIVFITLESDGARGLIKIYSSSNQSTYKPKDLNETLGNLSLSCDNNMQHTTSNTTKQFASLILKQHETAYPDTVSNR